ncbi:Tannase/feruloyl esterase [Dipodascopsis uninucleata]
MHNLTVHSTEYYPAMTHNMTELDHANFPLGERELNQNAFCRLFGSISNLPSQNITFELWLVDRTSWNERYLAMGNGGLAGSVTPGVLAYGVNHGYATSQCDSGHYLPSNFSAVAGVQVDFLHNSVQTADWIKNSIHFTALASKYLIEKYYNLAPRTSYYRGCSTGGAQGFALVQNYPHDFNGIVAGAPGAHYSHLALSFLYNTIVTKGSAYLTTKELEGIEMAAISKCDSYDGIEDGLISDPEACDFNPYDLVCDTSTGKHNSSARVLPCISINQAEAMWKIYQGAMDSITGDRLYNRFFPGCEGALVVQEGVLDRAFTEVLMQNLWGKGLDYNGIDSFDFHSDVPNYDSIVGRQIDNINPDISTFILNGGKLLIHQGWSDEYNAQDFVIEYFDKVSKTISMSYQELSDSMRIFFQPGVRHCGGGYGPNVFDPVEAVVEWFEKGRAPDKLIATQYHNNIVSNGIKRTRPYCAWPKIPTYKGSGDINLHESFECR